MLGHPGDFLGLTRRARETPDAVALLAPGREPLTWRQLAAQLQNSREMFDNAGIKSGEVVALALPNGPELIVTFLASAMMGSCAPLDPALTEDEFRFYLGRLQARTLILLDGGPMAAANAARSLRMRIVRIHAPTDRPSAVFEIAATEGEPAAEMGRKIDAALLLFTSATTDSPKLVPLTWANLHSIASLDSLALELTAQDRLLSLMPLFHLHGLAAALSQLFVGGSVICVPKFEPASLTHWLSELRPSWLCSNPPMSRSILTLANARGSEYSSLRFIRSGTAASEPGLLDALEIAMGVPVVDGYGMTETGGITRNTARARKPGSVGPSSGLELAIVEGEIVVRGPSVTSGYLDNPEANALAFRDGWFHTGDIGHLDDEGFLFITGRLKELINRGGKKVSPQEVEAALLAHPAVAEAAACAIPHVTLGEDVAAAVVLREGAAVSESELRGFAASRLASYKIPRRIGVLDAIPRTATGKPRRSQLADHLQIGALSEGVGSRMPDPVESLLMEVWRRVLAVEAIDVTSDFFALGGDSLRAAAMLTEVQRTLGTSAELVDRVDFFDDPTIERLARIAAECGARLTDAPNAGAPRILALRSTGSSVPIFSFPASAQDPYYFRHLAKKLDSEQPFYVVCHPEPIRHGRLVPVEDLARSCVEMIRSKRPHGEYILAGHCYGGVLAFEAARQLMAQGSTVVRLLLFDAATPGYPKIHKQWRRYASKAGEVASSWQRGKSAITAQDLRRHLHMLKHIFTRRRRGDASRILTAIGSDALTARRPEKELNGMAMWEYTPRDFHAPIVHFLAADQPVSTEVLSDPRLGWNDVARAGLEAHSVRGDHNTILAAENVAQIAEYLRAEHCSFERALAVTAGSK